MKPLLVVEKYVLLAALLFFVVEHLNAQQSITKKEIAVVTQLTLVKVDSTDIPAFKKSMSSISKLAKKAKLEDTYDWLTYDAGDHQFLIVNFSEGIEDFLTLESYKDRFKTTQASQRFLKEISILKSLKINVVFNILKEMILPWSTVGEISVSKFPLATMEVYDYATASIEELDKILRKQAKMLKNSNFPYPLEVSRGSVGAYGKLFLVWFYDEELHETIYSNLDNWMDNKGNLLEYKAVTERLNSFAKARRTFKPRFETLLSY